MIARRILVTMAWLLLVHAAGLTPSVHAHGSPDLITFILSVLLVLHVITIAFACFLPARWRYKLRFIAIYISTELLGALLIWLGDDDLLFTAGGWIYATGLFGGPIAGWIWLSNKAREPT